MAAFGRTRLIEGFYFLIERVAKQSAPQGRTAYRILCDVFSQQCEGKLDAVLFRKATGGEIIINLSDVDAMLDGHEDAGYQVQLSEPCSAENER